MSNYLKIQNLEVRSKEWNRRTVDLLIMVAGSGNMFGGHSKLVHVTLHGDNSISETGSITLNGIATMSYNIERGANGNNSQRMSYYKGQTEFKNLETLIPTYHVEIQNSCGGAEEAMRAILHAEKDCLIEKPYTI